MKRVGVLTNCVVLALGVGAVAAVNAGAKPAVYINAAHEAITQPALSAPSSGVYFGAAAVNGKGDVTTDVLCGAGTTHGTLGGEWMGAAFGRSTLEVSATDCTALTPGRNETCTVAEPVTAQLSGQLQWVSSFTVVEEVVYPAASNTYQHWTLFTATLSCTKQVGTKTKRGSYSGTYVAEGSGEAFLSRHAYDEAMKSGELGSTIFLNGGGLQARKTRAKNTETGVEEEVGMSFHKQGKKGKPDSAVLELHVEQNIGEEVGIEYAFEE